MLFRLEVFTVKKTDFISGAQMLLILTDSSQYKSDPREKNHPSPCLFHTHTHTQDSSERTIQGARPLLPQTHTWEKSSVQIKQILRRYNTGPELRSNPGQLI